MPCAHARRTLTHDPEVAYATNGHGQRRTRRVRHDRDAERRGRTRQPRNLRADPRTAVRRRGDRRRATANVRRAPLARGDTWRLDGSRAHRSVVRLWIRGASWGAPAAAPIRQVASPCGSSGARGESEMDDRRLAHATCRSRSPGRRLRAGQCSPRRTRRWRRAVVRITEVPWHRCGTCAALVPRPCQPRPLQLLDSSRPGAGIELADVRRVRAGSRRGGSRDHRHRRRVSCKEL